MKSASKKNFDFISQQVHCLEALSMRGSVNQLAGTFEWSYATLTRRPRTIAN
jgi:hypothetical protein